MNTPEESYYCSHCKKKVTWHLKPVNHRTHLIITLCTLGMWLPAWLGMTLLKIKYCDFCQEPLSEE